MRDLRLLIHHHAPVYQAATGELFLASFIGRWIDALSEHVGEIGLLTYQTTAHLVEQDEMITADNVKLWGLGVPGKTWDRFPRIKRLKQVCSLAAQSSDGLLIRGVTPRQLDVWRATPLKNKAYLLVGSLFQTRPEYKISFWGLYKLFMTYWRRREVKQIAKNALLLANSPLLVDEFGVLFGKRAKFVPTNSIRETEFSDLSFRPLSKPTKLLFCGRVVPEKGIRELIHALAQLRLDDAYELDIVGSADMSFRSECEQLAENLKIAGHIRWHGYIPYGPELLSFYRQADVFVLPTYYEGFPHVIWEAAAGCCPIITTNVGGIPAILKHEVHGLLVPPKNVGELAASVRRVCQDSELRRSLIKQAYQIALNFSVDACARQLVDVLNDEWNNEKSFS